MQSYKHNTDPSKGKKPENRMPTSATQPLPFPRKTKPPRPRLSRTIFEEPQTKLTASQTAADAGTSERKRWDQHRSSNTWSSSSADLDIFSETEDVDDRSRFVTEYNRLANKYGIRSIVIGDFSLPTEKTSQSLPNRKGSWISRLLRQGSSGKASQTATIKPGQHVRHHRSISDLALNFVHYQRREGLKNEDLHGLVRLCGKSVFYLPSEYAPGSLVLPTCLRATAQHLVQHAGTSGIFRISGSVRVTNALYNYYCADADGDDVATTTRCPNLPVHLNVGVHDVASTFKRFLAGLPGGILGSLGLFDALVGIHSQLHGHAESTRTKETQLRARLIALAISTVKSNYQRELICAVFGLLCIVGRTAEKAPREDKSGRPLPTSDLMGYSALAIIFGPLLLGDLLNSYSMRLADPAAGLIILPLSPVKPKKRRRSKEPNQGTPAMLTVDRVLVANDVTEMLLVHWRDIVRHLKDFDVATAKQDTRSRKLRSSVSENFRLKGPPEWSSEGLRDTARMGTRCNRAVSLTPFPRLGASGSRHGPDSRSDQLPVQRSRSRPLEPAPSTWMTRGHSMVALSPTAEESPANQRSEDRRNTIQAITFPTASTSPDKIEWQSHPPPVSTSLPVASITESESPVPGSDRQYRRQRHVRENHAEPRNITSDYLALSDGETPPQAAAEIAPGETPSSAGTTRRYSYNASGSVLTLDQGFNSSTKIPTAVHTPFQFDKSDPPDQSHLDRRVPPSNGKVQIMSASSCVMRQTPQERNSNGPEEICLNENITLGKKHSGPKPVLFEKQASSSIIETIPGFRHSLFHQAENPPDHIARRTTQEKLGDLSDKEATEKSSTWSLRHLISRTSPRSSLKEKYSCQNQGQSPAGLNNGKRNISTRCGVPSASDPGVPSADDQGTLTAWGPASGTLCRRPDSGLQLQERLPTPDWKRKLLKRRSEDKRKSTFLSPEKMSMFERTPPSAVSQGDISIPKSKALPPINSRADATGGLPSLRSASKPASGSVKAMAAKFNSVSEEPPTAQGSGLEVVPKSDLRGSQSFMIHSTKTQSSVRTAKSFTHTYPKTPENPTNSKAVGVSPMSSIISGPLHRASALRSRQNLKPTPSQAGSETTPFKEPKLTTQRSPVGFVAAREDPNALATGSTRQDYEVDGQLYLGTMVQPQEEPPIPQHLRLARHPSGGSSRSRVTQYTSNNSTPHSERKIPLLGRSNSVLYRQVRSLQKQLDHRHEELQQLRQQVDTMYSTDVGTLSEQLRQAKRECKMWRERAEAAEKRLAVFDRFAARFRGMRTGKDDISRSNQVEESLVTPNTGAGADVEPHGASSYSQTTESDCAFRNRTCHSLKQRGLTGANGVESPESKQDQLVWSIHKRQEGANAKDESSYMVQLWAAAEELIEEV
ncbi:hypothetical protein JX266_004884 [Neoarthrinium moseri]|nr:hypothetical protein JX266_004884 [Neoarthrinium moseri]